MNLEKFMKKYEILEHKADLKIRTFGKTKGELFLNMMIAMLESMKPEGLKGRAKREIKTESNNHSTLLVDFLSEVLYLSQVNKEVYTNIKFQKLTDTKLEGDLVGQKFERIGLDIKGVTYHSLDIHQKKNRTWEATVLFDI
jgi:SHS2 domain-containing protein